MAQGGPSAAIGYESLKREYLNTGAQCTRLGSPFVPMVAETLGAWGPTALWVFRRIARQPAVFEGEDGQGWIAAGFEDGTIKVWDAGEPFHFLHARSPRC